MEAYIATSSNRQRVKSKFNVYKMLDIHLYMYVHKIIKHDTCMQCTTRFTILWMKAAMPLLYQDGIHVCQTCHWWQRDRNPSFKSKHHTIL